MKQSWQHKLAMVGAVVGAGMAGAAGCSPAAKPPAAGGATAQSDGEPVIVGGVGKAKLAMVGSPVPRAALASTAAAPRNAVMTSTSQMRSTDSGKSEGRSTAPSRLAPTANPRGIGNLRPAQGGTSQLSSSDPTGGRSSLEAPHPAEAPETE